MALDASTPAQRVAREVHDAAVGAIDRQALARVRAVDAAFDARIAEIGAEGARSPRKQRFVTPVADTVAAIASGILLASAWGAGRLTGPDSWVEQPPVVGATVTIMAVVAVGALLVGAVFAGRERQALAADPTKSALVTRTGALWATVVVSAIGIPGMFVRIGEADLPILYVALALSFVVPLVAAPLAVLSRRDSRGAPSGPGTRRPTGDPEQARRFAREDAAAKAEDDANDVLASLDDGARADIAAAYAEAVQEVLRRGVLPAATRKVLTRTDPVAARYLL
jgi:hypothetical protein